MGKYAKALLLALLMLVVGWAGYLLGTSSQGDIISPSRVTRPTSKEEINSKLSSNEIDGKIKNIIKILDQKYLRDIDQKKLEEGIYKGLVSSLGDVYTVYYDKDEYKELMQQSQGEFGGVGIEVSSASGEYIEVVAPIKDTPAEKAGIKAGDKIVEIDGKTFMAKDMNEAVKHMRGNPGEKVKITVMRTVNGKDERMDFDLVREIIHVESVHSQMLEGQIGYIQITNFQADTYDEFVKAFEELEKKGAKSLVLDLRNNPGGLLDVTIKIADYLLGEGVVMQTKYKDGSGETYKSDADHKKMPMVTLINAGSASASEVLSGALKDFNRSEILGEKSFGKGVVQQIVGLKDGSGVKVTISEFFTPKGNKIHGVGISPTKEVKLNEKAKSIGPKHLDDDNQLREAIDILK